MQKKAVLFFEIIGITLLFACNNESYKPLAETTVNADLSEKENILFSEIFDSVGYVKLETTDDALIESIRVLKYAHNRLYILDENLKTLFAFDANTGAYLWKIQNIGQGPGEYTQHPMDFDIDVKNNRLYLFCRVDKIQEYDLSGNFIRDYDLRLHGYSFAYRNGEMYIYCGNSPQRSDYNQQKIPNTKDTQWENFRLLIYNKKEDLLRKELPFESNPQLGGVQTYRLNKAFYSYDDEIRFFSPYSNCIYALNGEENIPVAYRIDFGKFDFPGNKNISDYSDEQLREADYAHGLHLCWENDQYLSVGTFMKGIFYDVLYTKKDRSAKVGDFYNNLDYREIDLVQATDDLALGYLSASNFFEENSYQETYYQGKTSALIKKIRSEITEDDNPVVFFYYFRK